VAKLISAPQSLAQPQFLDNLYRRGRCLVAAMAGKRDILAPDGPFDFPSSLRLRFLPHRSA